MRWFQTAFMVLTGVNLWWVCSDATGRDLTVAMAGAAFEWCAAWAAVAWMFWWFRRPKN